MLKLYHFRIVMHIDPEDYFLMPNGLLSTALHEKNFYFNVLFSALVSVS